MTVSFHVAPNLRTTQSQFPDLLRSRLLAKFTSAPSGRMNLAECMVRRVNAREKFRMKKVCVNVCGLWVESYLLAMMRYAAYLSFKTPRLY
jgi:hypothetical protein